MSRQRDKCLVCEVRPRKPGSPYCCVCGEKIASQMTNGKTAEPFVYIHWRGAVVGMFPVDGQDIYRPRLLGIDLKYVPKKHLIDLDRFCPGFTRDQVKKMKRAVRSVTSIK